MLASSGTMQQANVKVWIGEIMTVSALLAGFSMGMTGKMSTTDIRSYAQFIKAEFFGKNSEYCRFVQKNPPHGLPPMFDGATPNFDVGDSGDSCDPESECWVGHWATNNAAKVLGHEACSMTVEDVQAAYPTWWRDQVETKVMAVSHEVGYNSMCIIMTTVVIVFTGSLLRFSIVKSTDEPKAWVKRFYPVIFLMFAVPLFNFYNFMALASRVIRVKFHYCDDYITDDCMVSATSYWLMMTRILVVIAVAVLLLHLSLPTSKAEKEEKVVGEDLTAKLERLSALLEKGALTQAEFTQAKAQLFSTVTSLAA